jgi:uncharacterized membrane protein
MKKTIILLFSALKQKTKYVFFAGLFISFFLNSCVKEGDFQFDKLASNQFDPTIAAPFVSSRLTLKKLIDDNTGIVQVNTDNSLKLIYTTNKLVSVMAKNLFKIPDQNLSTDTTSMIFPPIPTGDSIYYSLTKPYPFITPNPGQGQRMDSVFIKTAELKLDITSDINHSGRIILTTPNITYPNGQVFSVTIPLNYTGSTIHVIKNVDISGCRINFNNSPGHSNELTFKYEHYLYGDGNPNNLTYFLSLKSDIINISYQKLFGYIGQQSFPLKDTLNLDIFNNQLSGQFEFNSVTVGLKALNSYGLPIRATIDKFQAQNGTNFVDINDFPSSTSNAFDISYPDINHIGQSVETNISNVLSTKLAQAINISPKKIIYNVNGLANPANNPNSSNFVLDTSNFSVDMHIELPLEGKVGGFVLQDTLAFDLKDIKDIEEATFRINTWNAFPLSANIQVYFTDILYNKLDSLVTNGQDIITSGIINPLTNMVSSATYKLSEFSMVKSRLRKIETAKKILIRARLTTPGYSNGQIIKISNNDYLDVKLGIKVKANINSK